TWCRGRNRFRPESITMRTSRVRSLIAAAFAIAAMSGCESAGHFSVFGYTTKPNYDEGIRTVHVPIFENISFRRGLEFDLTRAVIREIEQKTPYKVVSDRCRADTELTGTIMAANKNILNRNQLNEVREAEVVVTVSLIWKDLRSGEILSRPGQPPNVYPTSGIPA